MLDLADVVFRVGRAYGMTADRGIYQAVAVKDGRITAVGRSRDELDSLIGPGTAVIDDPELVLYPAFNDTHNHQLLAARDLDYVSLEQGTFDRRAGGGAARSRGPDPGRGVGHLLTLLARNPPAGGPAADGT
jgi:predicted amidohydrolase YtcJ